MGSIFDPSLIFEYIPEVLEGLKVTLLIFGVVLSISFVLSILSSVALLQKIPVISQLLRVLGMYTMHTPGVLQLFVMYYGFPIAVKILFGIDCNRWSPNVFVIITFSISTMIIMTEGIRASISSVDEGQYEAGYSVGMTRSQIFRRVIFPQAFRIVLPVFEMESCTLLKQTSTAYLIGATDMMSQAIAVGSRNDHKLEAYLAATIIFFSMNIMLLMLFQLLEKKFDFGIRMTE